MYLFGGGIGLTICRTILYAPFSPFTVLFCHVIETSNADDLQRLAQFTASLEKVTSVSQGIARLHRMCQILQHVAEIYVKAKAQQHQNMGMVGNDFDLYLAQLGFISRDCASRQGVAENGIGAGFAASGANETEQLGDWFSGNNFIMSLMEEDLLAFNSI